MPFAESFAITQGLFLKSLAIIYVIAFASLLPQIKGLYGEKGICPLVQRYPDIFPHTYSDSWLIVICWIGMAASAAAIAEYFTALNLAIAWITYLCLVNVGSPFLNFQWDSLLLDAGAVAIFYALLVPAPPIFIWTLWLLIFRFMFASGYTKWRQGSREWRRFSALDYHYETQPLPTRLAYYLHHQPRWFSRASVGAVYFFELFVPLLIFTPQALRIYAFALLILFQLLLIATGNFAFFNLLTIVLCLPLLSDPFIQWAAPYTVIDPLFSPHAISWTIVYIIGAFFFFIHGLALAVNLYPHRTLRFCLNPFRGLFIASTYGLFVHMSQKRYEITIEGSHDGIEWKEYIFRYKPGQPQRAPKTIAPYQPRLDWQMWFAAMGSYQSHPWLSRFVTCLLKQSPEVLKLLEHNPFPDAPPRFIRCRRLRYSFTKPAEKEETGCWWKVKEAGPYLPPCKLKNP